MKKITLLLAFILVSLATTFTSCKKPANTDVVLFTAYFDISNASPTKHSFSVDMHVYPPVGSGTGSVFVDGIQSPNPPYSMALNISGVTTGSYALGSGQASSITFHLDNVSTFTTGTPASGTINITQFDANSGWVKGNFSGTVVNPNNLDTIKITNGVFSQKY